MPPTGPELIPLKAIVYDCELVILIKDIKSKRTIREERINYGNVEERKWLGKVTYWAVTNGYSVETFNEKDFDNMSKEG